MTDEEALHDDATFKVWTPIFAVAHHAARRLPQDAALVVTAQHEAGRLVPLFTDEDLADRFIRERGWPNLMTVGLATPEDLLLFLERLTGSGVTHVKFDPGSTAPLVPISLVIGAARRSPGEGKADGDGQTDPGDSA